MTSHGNTYTDQLVLSGGCEDGCDLVQGEIVNLEDSSTLSVIVKKPSNMKYIGPSGEDSIVNEGVLESDEPNLSISHLLKTKSDCLPCTTASINSLESPKILPARLIEEASSNQFSKTSDCLPPGRSRLQNRLSLQRKGRKTFSAETPKLTNPAQQLLNLDEILQASPILSADKNLYQAGVKLGIRIELFQERRTKSARVTSVRQRPAFLSGDAVWSSDDEVDSVREVRRLDEASYRDSTAFGKLEVTPAST